MNKRMKRFSIFALLLGGIILGSCGSDTPETPAETLSVSPTSIEAGRAKGDYKINLTSNARWTVAIQDETGQAVSWATLARSSGLGDATMTLHVQENTSMDTRKALMLFKTEGGLTVSLPVEQTGLPTGTGIRLGSYNLRISTLDSGDNVWSLRKERLKQSFLKCAFDVVGLQELDLDQQDWLVKEIGPHGYSFWFFSPYSQDGKGSRAQGIGFKTETFTMLENHYFWPSETPDVMTTNDTGDNGTYKRGGCCVVLRHNAKGFKIFFMNNHGCLNGSCNLTCAPYFAKMEKRFNPDGLPSFFVGDMNASPKSDVYKTYATYWQDSFLALEADNRKGSENTYNAYSNVTGKSRIDFVFYRGDAVLPLLYTCDNSLFNGLYPSDHFPVYLDVQIVQ